jgi:hypothetical protein
MSDVITAALVGALITSLLAPYIIQGSERRKRRAEVLDALSQVELNRWAASPHIDFRNSVRELRTTALICRTDRKMTEHYIYLASVCRFSSERDYEESNQPVELKGMIPSDLSNLATQAADALVILLWHPWRSKPFKKKKLKSLVASVEKYKKKEKREAKKHKVLPATFWDVKY